MTIGRGTVLLVWGAPLLLAVATAVGLVAALLGDGLWDALSWAALGVPLAVAFWFACARKGALRARFDADASPRRR